VKGMKTETQNNTITGVECDVMVSMERDRLMSGI
jgi:hypothetical protein